MMMAGNQMHDEQKRKDFFISYTGKDRAWAEWIAMQLEEAGYHIIIQAWDFRPGSNFVAEMDDAAKRADRTLLVLSPAYLVSDYAFAEWAAAFRHDPKGKQGKLLPVRIQYCEVEGLLGPIVYIDLVDLDEQRAREQLLAGVQRGRAKPATVAFPTSASLQVPVDRPVFPGSLPPVWNVPYPQNPLFVGHEDLLAQLTTTLHTGQPTALSQPQAISGLGGIGKTQLALEYAYRYRQEYQAVLWALADTREALTSSCLSIATLLNLPEKDAPESDRVIAAVKNWLQTSTGWLLILDNTDDLALARDFLPPSVSGHVLLTTRAQATGRFARRLEVDILSAELGALFLLRRAGLLIPDAPLETASLSDVTVAKKITEELGGLPLALDQAGAYIEETGCGLSDYQQRYQTHRAGLLRRRGGLVGDHPDPVATTWALAFDRVQQTNPAAADLLRLCAFLAPDAIPEEMIIGGATLLGGSLERVAADAFLFDQAVEALRAYSLLRRNSTSHTLSLHRLVQVVLRDAMDQHQVIQWAERASCLVNQAFPTSGAFDQWDACAQYLPHVLVSLSHLFHKEKKITLPEAAEVLRRAGWYLGERGQQREAEELLQYALMLQEQGENRDELAIARAALALGWLYEKEGKYAEAEPLYLRTLSIMEQQLGSDHRETSDCLNNLANLYSVQGKYEQAEPLLVRALSIREQQLGPLHPDTLVVQGNYVSLLRVMRRGRRSARNLWGLLR